MEQGSRGKARYDLGGLTETVGRSWEVGPPSFERRVGDLISVLNSASAPRHPDRVVYRVWREAERGPWESEGLRYDLTEILPGEVGGEFFKTFGHYHASSSSWPRGFPELYQVLAGKGLFLCQRPGGGEVLLSLAGVGEVVLVPPGFGHVTVNVGEDPLLVANLVWREGEALYEPFARLRGGAWHVLSRREPPGFSLRPNSAYPELRLPRLRPPLRLPFGLLERARRHPGEFRFLAHPEAALPLWMESSGFMLREGAGYGMLAQGAEEAGGDGRR